MNEEVKCPICGTAVENPSIAGVGPEKESIRYGQSVLDRPMFSVTDMQFVLDENRTLKLRIKELERR